MEFACLLVMLAARVENQQLTSVCPAAPPNIGVTRPRKTSFAEKSDRSQLSIRSVSRSHLSY
jgi:hypothetical protein